MQKLLLLVSERAYDLAHTQSESFACGEVPKALIADELARKTTGKSAAVLKPDPQTRAVTRPRAICRSTTDPLRT